MAAWLAPYGAQAPGPRAALASGEVGGVARALSAAGAKRFVPAQDAPVGEAYEAFIFRTGCVPTRDNLHDLFNGLVWLRFPRAKQRLNVLQAAEIARHGIGARRGALRDALTLFDENGAVLDAPPVLWRALDARDWHTLFVTERSAWRDARLLVFGHALLEKLESPRKALTAHVLRAPGGVGAIAPDDTAICEALDAAHLAAKPFSPLPVLGVPGWWGPNENFSFYDDSDVFRPRRTLEPTPKNRSCSMAAALEAPRTAPN